MKIPEKFEKILRQNQSLHSLVLDVVNDNSFGRILKDNKLFFFEEYTEHGIEHIEMVLKAADFLIPNESFEYVKPKEVAILILAIVLHDIGMHTEFSTFKAMIDGKYDDVRVDVLDKKTWQELWQDYLSGVKHWSSKQLENVFGKPENEEDVGVITIIEDVKNAIKNNKKDKLDGSHKKLIGEFIRKYHARLTHEIALKGLVGNETIPFGNENLREQDRQFAGIVARSHGMNIRDTFEYLKEIAYDDWKNPADMNIVFLMVLLRIADYLQIDKTRTDKTLLKVKTFNSPLSLKEHQTHLSISYLTFQKEDPELISVTAEPKDAQMYVKIQNLIKDIQHEFDLSWAILGETYGFLPDKKPKIKFRRITSNLEYPTFLKKIDYVPKKIAFEVNNEVAKLLVAPLYGDNPTYGVRELVQNATDACKERMKIEQDKGNANYEPLVTVSIDKIDEENYLFKIKDNGKGMTLDEILNYFLSVGSSFRQTVEWKKEFESNITRNGKFGIGVLAAFLLGNEISVKTKSYKEVYTYSFKTKCDSKFVEIEKTLDNFEISTEIKILMSYNEFRKLIEKNKSSDLLWFDWYIDKKPSVLYTLNGETLAKHMFFNLAQMRTIFAKNNDKIQWSYQPVKERPDDEDERNLGGEITNWTFVVCNGIIITLNSEYCDFSQYYSSIIQKRPSLIIEDSQNILPLRLDRNDFSTNLLPFEDDLLFDVSKSFIAQLLTLPNISTEVQYDESYTYFPQKDFSVDFCYSKNGFTLAYDYFIKKLRIKKYHLLRIIIKRENWVKQDFLPIFQNFDDYIIYPEFSEITGKISSWENEDGYESSQESLVAPESGGCVLLSQKIYNSFLNNYYPLRWSKYHFQMEWENKKYIVYNLKHYKRKTNIFEEKICTSMLQKMGENVQSIQEIPFTYFNYQEVGKTLNQLLKKYIGDNVIIPYNIEERKKLYPLAFEELKNYMKDYEKP